MTRINNGGICRVVLQQPSGGSDAFWLRNIGKGEIASGEVCGNRTLLGKDVVWELHSRQKEGKGCRQ